MNPICYGCKAEMICDKTGVLVESVSGLDTLEVRRGDCYACPMCGVGVICSFAAQPLWVRGDPPEIKDTITSNTLDRVIVVDVVG